MATVKTCAVLMPLPEAALAKLRSAFTTLHYLPDFNLPAALAPEVDYIFTSWKGLPPDVKVSDLKNLKHIQMPTAGADNAIRSSAAIRELRDTNSPITLSTASGIHVLSIPPWVVGMTVNLYHQIHTMIKLGHTKKMWPSKDTVDYEGKEYLARNLYGRTAGMLGYGALGRETARLLKAMGMRIIAANTSGKATSETEYVLPGTGDIDGSLPDKFFSTKDPEAFDAFLRETDVLVCSLPGTPQTQYLLNAAKLALLKPESLFLNVGRGTLIASDELLKALDAGNLFGAAIDVTDPEPLQDNHPLWSHPRCIITPHTSGNCVGEYEFAADVGVANAERIREGKRPFNVVDLNKGY